MIRDRIAAVLEEHQSYDAACFTWSCLCGVDFHDADTHLGHVVDVLVRELKLRRIENGRAGLNEHPPRIGRGIAYMTAWEPAE